MFVVDCPIHQCPVLLFGSQAVVVNTPNGIELHWCCSCSSEGVELLSPWHERTSRVPLYGPGPQHWDGADLRRPWSLRLAALGRRLRPDRRARAGDPERWGGHRR